MSKTLIEQRDNRRAPWNKGRLVGQKRPLKPKEVWNIRARLQIEARTRDLAMFNLAINSKLRGCDLVNLKIDDLCIGVRLRDRATIVQKKTGRPVQFEITEQTRASVEDWLAILKIRDGAFFFQAGSTSSPTFRRANMLGLSMTGFEAPVWTTRRTARIRCGERRQHRYIKRRAT
jgi:integrase